MVYNSDDKSSLRLTNESAISFGIENNGMYMAKDLKEKDKKYTFKVYEYGRYLGTVSLTVPGKHNVYNALSVISVARKYKIEFEVINREPSIIYFSLKTKRHRSIFIHNNT